MKDTSPQKGEWANTMKEHRHYKEKLFREGKLVINDKENKND